MIGIRKIAVLTLASATGGGSPLVAFDPVAERAERTDGCGRKQQRWVDGFDDERIEG